MADDLIPNSDPAQMQPAYVEPAAISDGKPKIDEIERGTAASGYLKELCTYYPNDRIAPGLQSAWLPDKEVFYVAVHRFPKGTVDSRTVISKASADTLAEAEAACMEIWRSNCRQVEEARRAALQKPV